MRYPHYRRCALLLPGLLVLLAGCGADATGEQRSDGPQPRDPPPAADALRAQRRAQWEGAHQQWIAQGITHYRFTISTLCLCGSRADPPITVEVRDGQPIGGVRAMTGKRIDVTAFGNSATIEQLFTVVDEVIDQYPDKLTVTYDPRFGYPASIGIDREKRATDDEVYYTVKAFEVLSGP